MIFSCQVQKSSHAYEEDICDKFCARPVILTSGRNYNSFTTKPCTVADRGGQQAPPTICPAMLWQVSCHVQDSIQPHWEHRSRVSKHMLLTLAPRPALMYFSAWMMPRVRLAPNRSICAPDVSSAEEHHQAELSLPLITPRWEGAILLMRKWFMPQPTWFPLPGTSPTWNAFNQVQKHLLDTSSL